MTKSSFRKDILSKSRRISYSKRLFLSKKAVNNLDLILKKYVKYGSKILSFIPLKNEVDVLQFINKTKMKYDIFIPFMKDVSFEMVQYKLPLVKKKFNIKEPPKTSNFYKKNIDVIITPVVGVDGNYKRIGFGKGMYDRFYQKQLKRQKYKPLVIFIQLEKFFTQNLICDDYDIKADIYITAKDILELGLTDGRDCRNSRCRRSCWFFNLKENK
jgi:5-formyltetrahydrofolate cyclo-ligase